MLRSVKNPEEVTAPFSKSQGESVQIPLGSETWVLTLTSVDCPWDLAKVSSPVYKTTEEPAGLKCCESHGSWLMVLLPLNWMTMFPTLRTREQLAEGHCKLAAVAAGPEPRCLASWPMASCLPHGLW